MPHMQNSATKKFFATISLKRGYKFDQDNLYVKDMERPFVPTKIEAPREVARVVFMIKHP